MGTHYCTYANELGLFCQFAYCLLICTWLLTEPERVGENLFITVGGQLVEEQVGVLGLEDCGGASDLEDRAVAGGGR